MMRAALPLLLLLPAAASADERTLMVTSFDHIRVEGPFEVTVATGASANAVVSGDRRAIDSVAVRVEDRTLIVAANPSAWGGWPGDTPALPRVTVGTRRLDSAVVMGGGRLAIDHMEGEEVSLALTGAGVLAVADVDAAALSAVLTGTGTIAVQGSVGSARFLSNGAGSFDAGGLVADELFVQSQSAGDSRFTARDTATVTATGAGAVVVEGDPVCTVNGPGTVRCGAGE